MTEFSINSLLKVNTAASDITDNSPYKKMKKDYDAQMTKMQKTDFANSTVALEKELTMLAKLKEAAQNEGLEEEIKWIKDREQTIYTKLANNKETPNSYYIPVMYNNSDLLGLSKDSIPEKKEFDGQSYVESFVRAYNDTPIDENAGEILKILGSIGLPKEQAFYVIKRCFDDEGAVSEDKLKAMQMFADANVSTSMLPQLFEDLVVYNEEAQTRDINLSSCRDFCDLKKMGMDEVNGLKASIYFADKFGDKDSIKANIKNMLSAGIGSESAIKLIDILKTSNENDDRYSVNDASVRSITRIKKTLNLTRDNEKEERDNPINQLGVQMFTFGDEVMVIKDGKITYITPIEGASVYNLQKEYDELVSKIEDNLLCEFAKKYKNEDGTIDSKYVRTLVSLRRLGITYPQLLNLTDKCINEDGSINKNIIENIGVLKKAGALSDDISAILDACRINQNAEYDEQDIIDAVDLTRSYISGSEISEYLPGIRQNEDFKEFIIDYAEYLNDSKNLKILSVLVQDDNGNIDENAMNVINNLYHNIIAGNDKYKQKDFLDYANRIVYAAMNEGEDTVNDEGTGIVSIMSRNKINPDDIIKVLDSCKDEHGKIDEKLSEIVWDMNLQNPDTKDIMTVLNACRQNGVINHNMSDTILSFFESGESINKVIEYLT